MQKTQAAALAVLLTFSSPVLPAHGQVPNFESLFSLGKDIYQSNTGRERDEEGYSLQGIYEVDDIYQEAKDAQPDFLKDLFLGTDPNRPLHPSTTKLFKILDHAQKGLQTYQTARNIYRAIQGKNSEGIVGGVRSILTLYGVIDPNAAVALASTNAATGPLGNVLTAQAQKVQEVAFRGKPQTAYSWYFKGKNHNVVASTAAQQAANLVVSKPGQALIAAQEEFTTDTIFQSNQYTADAGLSSANSRQLSFVSNQMAESANAVAGKAQSDNSSQKVLKRNAELLAIATGQTAAVSNQINELNDNQGRTLGTLSNLTALQGIELDKMTSLQALGAGNLNQLTNLNAEARSSNDRQSDERIRRMQQAVREFNDLYMLGTEEPSLTTTTAKGEQ
ncbi:MAG: hypothetical protein HC768_18640 [Acaryochloris sp. CRU_2_0]|nr:hypothetical protein [Acaryochloris sp. CRU_2_0]